MEESVLLLDEEFIAEIKKKDHGDTENPSDMSLVEKTNFQKPNKWIEIPAGRAKYQSLMPTCQMMIDLNNIIFYQGDEANCVHSSLENALMYISN